jgi:hypothetical protein
LSKIFDKEMDACGREGKVVPNSVLWRDDYCTNAGRLLDDVLWDCRLMVTALTVCAAVKLPLKISLD